MVRSRSLVPVALAVAGMAATLAAGPLASTASAAPSYTVKTLHFKVTIGPSTGRETCDIVGDLYQPRKASTKHRVPAIITTNGFGGSKDDQAGLGEAMAARGYEVLSYSGLGFGGSGCKITLDDPTYDGEATQQLVSYLGGASGIVYTDAQHTTAAPLLRVVRLDKRDHAGKRVAHDPRVGLIGGSYGGGFQFAAASVDPRIDTIVPVITWNDLSYSLAPNNIQEGTGVSTLIPGAVKLTWGLGFTGLGVLDGLENAQADPSRTYPCPNFADFVCPALVTGGTLGYFQPGAISALRHASVASYVAKIRVPTLLMQGENDTLFNLNEATATYRALKAQGTPVRMIWQSWGHSGGAGDGEFSMSDPNPRTQYETARVLDWFDHYLKGTKASLGPQFAYFRDWVKFTGDAAPAYATASRFPVGSARTYRFTGQSGLTTSTTTAAGAQAFTTVGAGAPTSIDPMDVVGFTGIGPLQLPIDVPGTYAQWSTPALTKSVDVVGSPVVRLAVSAPTAAVAQGLGAAGMLTLFLRVEDVAPDGTVSTIHGLEAPVRIADVSKPFTVTLPGIVHRFAAGHRIRLVVAGGSINYRGGDAPTPVVISSGSSQTLSLPVVG